VQAYPTGNRFCYDNPMFVDEVEIIARSGSGGHGCISFRREKFVPKGGPNGGDGGNGADIVFEVDPQMNTLLVFAGKHHWIAGNGQGGEGSNRTGKSADHLIIRVPPGTIIYDQDKNIRLKELVKPSDKVVLLKGGQGGWGNSHYATPTNQAPRKASPGQPGLQRRLRLELKLIADVGLVGAPNAGKSTLLSRCTKARPKIADYPFTTLEPQLGIVELSDHRQFVMADIPGLIEGAHEGYGLGDAFLRHIERTRVIVHLIEICPLAGLPSPAQTYQMIRQELKKHSTVLAEKPEIVVANKMDLTDSQTHLEELQNLTACEILPLSAVTGQGLDKLLEVLWKRTQAEKERANENC